MRYALCTKHYITMFCALSTIHYAWLRVPHLEAGVKTNEEGMISSSLEDVFLCLHPVDVLVIRHQLLLDHLHGVDPPCRLELDHEDLGVGAAADHLDHVEVAEADHVLVLMAGGGRGPGALICRHQHRLRVEV